MNCSNKWLARSSPDLIVRCSNLIETSYNQAMCRARLESSKLRKVGLRTDPLRNGINELANLNVHWELAHSDLHRKLTEPFFRVAITSNDGTMMKPVPACFPVIIVLSCRNYVLGTISLQTCRSEWSEHKTLSVWRSTTRVSSKQRNIVWTWVS